MPLDRQCPVCERKYAHLTGCPVEAIHKLLDDRIGKFGLKNVVVVATTALTKNEANAWPEKPV